MPALRHGLFLLIEKLLRWCIHPRLRARLLGLLGAHIGSNVRVYETQFFNLQQGFRHLYLADGVHVGTGCRLDLKEVLTIGARSTLSPGVTVLTHADPGASQNSAMIEHYAPHAAPTAVGEDCWIGAHAVLLAGTKIGNLAVVAAGAVVTTDVPAASVVAGSPAVVKKTIVVSDRPD
ncbi:MAG: DapH/DapD/GlmU-related protein [Rudaea sp.]|uniref:acyltransferase n=1 Tax=Rudaea sp. TaxID=2136325 RepID=UPI0039E54916